MRRTAMAVAVLACAATAAHGDAVARYKKMVRRAAKAKTVAVEKLYAAAEAAAEQIEHRITTVDVPKREPAVTGLSISTDEVLFARPDPTFFADLAQRKGSKADQAFFAALALTRPDGVWAVYVDQQTDVTGCTRFDSPELIAAYRAWIGFAADHPGAYATEVATEVHGMEDVIATDTCACGTQQAVTTGLEAIVAAFPDRELGARAKQRLAELHAGTAGFRFSCASG